MGVLFYVLNVGEGKFCLLGGDWLPLTSFANRATKMILPVVIIILLPWDSEKGKGRLKSKPKMGELF